MLTTGRRKVSVCRVSDEANRKDCGFRHSGSQLQPVRLPDGGLSTHLTGHILTF